VAGGWWLVAYGLWLWYKRTKEQKNKSQTRQQIVTMVMTDQQPFKRYDGLSRSRQWHTNDKR